MHDCTHEQHPIVTHMLSRRRQEGNTPFVQPIGPWPCMTPFLPSAQSKQLYGEHLGSPVCMHFGQAQNAVCASAHMQRTIVPGTACPRALSSLPWKNRRHCASLVCPPHSCLHQPDHRNSCTSHPLCTDRWKCVLALHSCLAPGRWEYYIAPSMHLLRHFSSVAFDSPRLRLRATDATASLSSTSGSSKPCERVQFEKSSSLFCSHIGTWAWPLPREVWSCSYLLALFLERCAYLLALFFITHLLCLHACLHVCWLSHTNTHPRLYWMRTHIHTHRQYYEGFKTYSNWYSVYKLYIWFL